METEKLKDLKDYLKLDSDENDEDKIIEGFYTAAMIFAEGQTGKKLNDQADECKQLYELALFQMVSHFYENRAITVTGTIISEIPLSAQTILNHIALCGDFI